MTSALGTETMNHRTKTACQSLPPSGWMEDQAVVDARHTSEGARNQGASENSTGQASGSDLGRRRSGLARLASGRLSHRLRISAWSTCGSQFQARALDLSIVGELEALEGPPGDA